MCFSIVHGISKLKNYLDALFKAHEGGKLILHAHWCGVRNCVPLMIRPELAEYFSKALSGRRNNKRSKVPVDVELVLFDHLVYSRR